jgi:hypothetical protein
VLIQNHFWITSFTTSTTNSKMSADIDCPLTGAQVAILKSYQERYRDSHRKERRQVYKEAWKEIEVGPPAVEKNKISAVKSVNDWIVTICRSPFCSNELSHRLPNCGFRNSLGKRQRARKNSTPQIKPGTMLHQLGMGERSRTL